MPSTRTDAEDRKRMLLNAEIKGMLGPCMISFSIPLFIPGLTITLVAFSDETGFSKYGPLHVIGIVILAVASALLVVGFIMRCACRSKVYPFPHVPSPHHKVTTHEKPKKAITRTLTRDRLPPLVHGPQPGGTSAVHDHAHINRILTNPHRIIDSEIFESDSEEVTSSEDESDSTPRRSNTHSNSNSDLPSNNFMNSPKRDIKPVAIVNTKSGSGLQKTSDLELTDSQREGQLESTTLKIENEVDLKSNLMCPSYTNMRHSDNEFTSKERASELIATPPDEEGTELEDTPSVKPVSGWMSRQSHDKTSLGPKTLSETASTYSSSEVTEDRDVEEDECDDVTLTSRNCSTVPEIADLEERGDSVEVDRFNNVWRGDSQNSVEISSVLSQDEYSEESLSVISKDQLEPSGSRGRASSDSAMESGGDHSRALSVPHRYSNGGLVEEAMELEQGEVTQPKHRRLP